MTPESIAAKIIKSSRGRVMTEAGARQAIEDGLREFGDYKFRQGIKNTLEIASELSKPKTRSIITNIVEML